MKRFIIATAALAALLSACGTASPAAPTVTQEGHPFDMAEYTKAITGTGPAPVQSPQTWQDMLIAPQDRP